MRPSYSSNSMIISKHDVKERGQVVQTWNLIPKLDDYMVIESMGFVHNETVLAFALNKPLLHECSI